MSMSNVNTNFTGRRHLFNRFKHAVSLQISLWETCLSIDETVRDGTDVFDTIRSLAARYSDKALLDAELDTILLELHGKNVNASSNQDGNTCLPAILLSQERRFILAG